jgi:acetyl-CoA acetyltransferase
MVHQLNLQPIGRLINCANAGVDPRIMGIGPVAAIPKVLRQAGMNLADIDLTELNEAFASQSVAVIREAGLDPEKTNINGGAIALGHPLGCSGAKLTVQLLSDLKRLIRYGNCLCSRRAGDRRHFRTPVKDTPSTNTSKYRGICCNFARFGNW